MGTNLGDNRLRPCCPLISLVPPQQHRGLKQVGPCLGWAQGGPEDLCWFVVILYQQITQIYAGFISFFPTGDQENYVFGQCCERAEGVAALCGEGGT